ncbi:hypothetical protein B0H14DRAFT_2675599 [Mycena olivaceomarginata]|nr:hypothetical protein B0H14DRAFT_2675599 [Mycena olivaceomarginata]
MPADRNAYLAEHNRLTMTLDYNLAIMHPQLPHIISIIRPKLEVAMKNMTVEYVYAVLAALARLPDEKGKSRYLEHQRRYLTGLALVESTYLRQGIDTCVESFRLFTEIHLDALDRISNLFRLVHRSAYARNLVPAPDLVAAAHEFGDTLALWVIGSKRACVFHGRDVGLGYFTEVNALRQVLSRSVSPANKIHGKEAEYEIYARDARIAMEAGNPYSFPELPTTEVWAKPL